MPTMKLNLNGYPAPTELLKTVIAADALEQDKPMDDGLYLERETLLDDEYFEQSLDDYDDLLSMVDDGDWDE